MRSNPQSGCFIRRVGVVWLGGCRRIRWALVCALVACPSCALRTNKIEAPVHVPEAFSTEGPGELPGEWWTAFGDSQLNSLMDQALRNNFSLRTAWDRVREAQAVAAKSNADLWPTLEGSAGASRTRSVNTVQVEETSVPASILSQTVSQVVSNLTNGGADSGTNGGDGSQGSGGQNVTVTKERKVVSYQTDLSLGLIASYEVDLWGRIRSTYDASQLDVLATQEDLHAAAMTLTAEVARTWYDLVERQGQRRLLDEQLKTNESYLEIITLKFRRGQVSATDVLQQRQLVESTKSERVQVESEIRVLEHALAVLLGRSPGDVSIGEGQVLPTLPTLPKTGLPVDWVRRRPDVRAAELRVRAADRRVAAAIADQFPRLSLTVTAKTSAERMRDLFDNWLASVAANLVAPLFDAGLRRAEIERTRAIVSEQLNSYGQVILTSLSEVEDALVQESKQAEFLAGLRSQLELSRQSMEQTRENYTKGTMDFTRYLTTVLSHQQLERTHLEAQRRLVEFRIDLYRALGGSWELPPPAHRGVSGRDSTTMPAETDSDKAPGST